MNKYEENNHEIIKKFKPLFEEILAERYLPLLAKDLEERVNNMGPENFDFSEMLTDSLFNILMTEVMPLCLGIATTLSINIGLSAKEFSLSEKKIIETFPLITRNCMKYFLECVDNNPKIIGEIII